MQGAATNCRHLHYTTQPHVRCNSDNKCDKSRELAIDLIVRFITTALVRKYHCCLA